MAATAGAVRAVLLGPVHNGQGFRDHRVDIHGRCTVAVVGRVRRCASSALAAAHGMSAVAAAVVAAAAVAPVLRWWVVVSQVRGAAAVRG